MHVCSVYVLFFVFMLRANHNLSGHECFNFLKRGISKFVCCTALYFMIEINEFSWKIIRHYEQWYLGPWLGFLHVLMSEYDFFFCLLKNEFSAFEKLKFKHS